MSAREAILGRVRSAVHGGDAADAYARLPRAYTQQGTLTSDELVALMVERLSEYDAEVVECAPEALDGVMTGIFAASGRKIFVAPPELPVRWSVSPAWKIEGFELSFDHWDVGHGLTVKEIEQAEGVVTLASCGVAESGTIVLHHSSNEGRRVLSLLPDWHLCVLYASQIVEVLPEYFARFADAPRLATFIAGPSATADIEMTRIKGVHGPRFLNVIVVRDDR
jgi:L-lactate dehydrogenase complex protein LldG